VKLFASISVLLFSANLFCADTPTQAAASTASAPTPMQKVRIKEIAEVEGVRSNPLLGYGVVVGLKGTGDTRQTTFSTQMLANILQKMGVQVPPSAVRVNNIAAVFVTASLPPFAIPGTGLDVTVSSMGDAKSLEGGTLLLTALYAPDGKAYAQAQGSLVLGGYTAGAAGNSHQLNHPTAGRIPNGGMVERAAVVDLQQMPTVSLLLRDFDFAVTRDVAKAINDDFKRDIARAVDGRRIEINNAAIGHFPIPELIARVEDLQVPIQVPSKVVVNERTGTVVMGMNVRLGAVSVLHGGLEIEIATQFTVSQPNPLTNGQTTVVSETTVKVGEQPARRMELREGATVEDLVRGLQSIGATARDIVAILQAIKSAGGLNAELEVI
jgi:flagellar P-ring protein FlgI